MRRGTSHKTVHIDVLCILQSQQVLSAFLGLGLRQGDLITCAQPRAGPCDKRPRRPPHRKAHRSIVLQHRAPLGQSKCTKTSIEPGIGCSFAQACATWHRRVRRGTRLCHVDCGARAGDCYGLSCTPALHPCHITPTTVAVTFAPALVTSRVQQRTPGAPSLRACALAPQALGSQAVGRQAQSRSTGVRRPSIQALLAHTLQLARPLHTWVPARGGMMRGCLRGNEDVAVPRRAGAAQRSGRATKNALLAFYPPRFDARGGA